MSKKPPVTADHRRQHTPDAIRERLRSGQRQQYLRDFVFGAIDGTVTTFAVVSGVAGAGLSGGVVLILGVANLLGDGFSMAAGNYLGTRAEEEMRVRARRTEYRHIELYPAGEREELRQIFAAKGFADDDLERVVDVISADLDRWVDTMVTEELGLPLQGPNPLRAAVATFVAFVVVGTIPLLPFIVQIFAPVPHPFAWSTAMTAAAFFAVGAAKAKVVEHGKLRSGFETLLVGGLAAGLAFAAGRFLALIVGVG